MKSRDTLGLKSALNRVAADDISTGLLYLAGGTLASALIKLLIDRHNSCARAINDILKGEDISADGLAVVFDSWRQYICNTRAGRPSHVLKRNYEKIQRILEKIAKLGKCTPEATMLALKHVMKGAMSAEVESELRGAIQRYLNSQAIEDAAAITSILAGISNSATCVASGCIGFVMYIDYLKRKFPGVELAEDILETIAYLIAAIIGIKLLIAASPGIAGATGLAALLSTYKTALAGELQNAGLATAEDAEALVNEIVEEASQEQCQEEQIEQGPPPGDSPTSDTVEIPPSGNFLGDGSDQMKGVD